MKRQLKSLTIGLGLGAIAACSAAFSALGFQAEPIRAESIAQIQTLAQRSSSRNVAQNAKPEMQLQLSAAKQVKTDDKLTWQPLQSEARVLPGDVIRFTLSGSNAGQSAAQGLVLEQAIPPGTSLIARSAKGVTGPKPAIAYSIDGGKTYSPQPKVKVSLADGSVVERPAPVESYSHIQLKYSAAIAPATQVSGEYQVRVK